MAKAVVRWITLAVVAQAQNVAAPSGAEASAGDAGSSSAGGAACHSKLADALAENEQLRAEISRLKAAMEEDSGGVANATENVTLEASSVVLSDDGPVKKDPHEMLVLAAALFCMAVLCVLPIVAPFRQCCETRLHNVCPVIALFNFVVLVVTLSHLDTICMNDVFFTTVALVEVGITKSEQCLVGIASIFIMLVLWKFKDRIFDALGVENASSLIGEFRDWATCWSMWRFRPIELYIWKVEGLAAANLHKMNDIFIETSLGYNVNMRTRVHQRAGHSCIIKESLQLNFDEFDAEAKLKIVVRNQELVGSSELASVQLGATQVHRLEEPTQHGREVGWAMTTGRTGDTVWAQSRFLPLDLVPSGKIFVRFAPVDTDGSDGCMSCCCL